jgi:hypothetical protein
MLTAPPLRFIGELHRCSTLDELARVFCTGFGRVLDVPMYGFNVVQPGTTRLRATTAVGVSDVFVNTYIRDVMDDDPLRVGAHESGHAVYSLGLMSADEWEESDASSSSRRARPRRCTATAHRSAPRAHWSQCSSSGASIRTCPRRCWPR